MSRWLIATLLGLASPATIATLGAVGCGSSPASIGESTAADGSVEAADTGPDVHVATVGSADAQDGDDPDACAPCGSTLGQLCAGDAGLECPPDLGSPGFFDWARRQIGFDWGGLGPWRAPLCSALTGCQDLVRISFGAGVDCADDFLFDVNDKKFVAVIGACNVNSTCVASTACLPNRCVPLGPYPGSTDSPACPALPEAGVPDASSGSSCSIPVSANTYSNATDSGCQAFALCTPPCAPACPYGQYQLLCSGPPGTTDAAPAPVPSLNCTTDGGSQSSNTVEYCCQCLP